MPIHEAAGQAIHYEIGGSESGPMIVLLHSLGANLTMWRKVLPMLESRFRWLCIDFRGYGESSVSRHPLEVGDLAGDVLSLLDHLEIETAVISGISLGGLVAIWLGVNEPARMSGLILANTSARIGTFESWEQRIAAVQNNGMRELAKQAPARWFTISYRELHPGEMAEVEDMITKTSQQGYIDCCAILRDTDLRAALPYIGVPTLVISGTDDPATPPAQGRELANQIPGASYRELNASHLSVWECPMQFSAAVASFACQLEPTYG